MGIYDDPRVTTGEGRVRFDEIGDRVRGRITKAEVYVGMANGYRYELGEATVRQSSAQSVWPAAEVICTPSNLVVQLKNQKPDVGDLVDIELVDLRKATLGTAKIFKVETQKGMAAPAAPVNPPTAAPTDDPFG